MKKENIFHRLGIKIKSNYQALKEEKISFLGLSLIVINVVAMLTANIIACKVFSIGFAVLPAAVIVFPITYILSDVFSEVYGYKWSRITARISFTMNLLMVGFFQLAIIIPGVDEAVGNSMKSILGTTPWQLLAGLTAYMMGDLINDLVFQKLKVKQQGKNFWLRAVVSSLLGELIDSLIFMPLAMNLLPKAFLGIEFMTWDQLLIAIPTQAGFKTLYEICIVPVTALIVKGVKKYEGK